MAHGYLVPQVTVWPLSVPRKHLYGSQMFRMCWWRFGVTGFWLASLAVQSFRLVQVRTGTIISVCPTFLDLCLWSARVGNKDSSMQCRLDDVEDAHLPCSSLYPAALLYQVLGCFNICVYWFLLMPSLCLPYNNSNNISTSGRQSWDEQTAGADISAWKAWTVRLRRHRYPGLLYSSLAAWRIFNEFKFKGYCLNVFTILNVSNENCKCCFVSSTSASLTLSGKVEDRYSGL